MYRCTLLTILLCLSCVKARLVIPAPATEFNTRCAEALANDALSDAEVLCEHALEYQPEYWDALNNLGLVKLRQGDREGAKDFFIRSIRANQDMAQAWLNIGTLRLQDRQLSEAEHAFRSALRINPEYAEARANLGRTQLAKNQLPEAEKTFRHLALSYPTLVAGHFGLGVVHALQGHYKEAMECFERARLLNPDDRDVWMHLGDAYEHLARFEEAASAYRECTPLHECTRGLLRMEAVMVSTPNGE